MSFSACLWGLGPIFGVPLYWLLYCSLGYLPRLPEHCIVVTVLRETQKTFGTNWGRRSHCILLVDAMSGHKRYLGGNTCILLPDGGGDVHCLGE